MLESLSGMMEDAKELKAELEAGTVTFARKPLGYCEDCLDCGWRQVADPTGKVDNHKNVYTGVVRCTRCRYWDRVRADLGK